MFVNCKLIQISQLAKIAAPLTMYVSRQSWASIAKSKNVPLPVISEGMEYDNEEIARICIAAIQTNRTDESNSRIMNDL